MSIVKAINELSGKEAITIEDAIRNVELGGGDKSNEFIITVTPPMGPDSDFTMDKQFDEIEEAYEDGKRILVRFTENGPVTGLAERSVSMGGISYNFYPFMDIGRFASGDSSTSLIFNAVTINSNLNPINVTYKYATITFDN